MIRIENLTFSYHDEKPILKGLDLNFSAGSFHFLTGPSGSGKTTLLKIISMENSVKEGHVMVNGHDLAVLDREARALMRRKVGFVFQDFRLLPQMTILENVALPLRITGAYGRAQYQQVSELLAWVGLKEVTRKYPPELSGGEQQRAAIARAVVSRPVLLLADEPTGSVDDAMAERILHLFMELHRGGTTVVVATHNLTMARSFDRPILKLSDGRVDH